MPRCTYNTANPFQMYGIAPSQTPCCCIFDCACHKAVPLVNNGSEHAANRSRSQTAFRAGPIRTTNVVRMVGSAKSPGQRCRIDVRYVI